MKRTIFRFQCSSLESVIPKKMNFFGNEVISDYYEACHRVTDTFLGGGAWSGTYATTQRTDTKMSRVQVHMWKYV
jgi:hypothetical protein